MGDPKIVASRALDLLSRACGGVDLRTNPDLPIYEEQLADSLTTVSLILSIERDLGLTISPIDLDVEQWATPARFVADIERRVTAAS